MNESHFTADSVSVKIGVFGMLKRLWPEFMRHKLTFFASIGAVFAVAMAAPAGLRLFGYAIDDEALYRGVVSVGTVITDHLGVPIFGLTSSDIAHNLDAAKIKRLGEEMASLSRAFSPANRANKIDAEEK